MSTTPIDNIQDVYQRRWIAGFILVGAVILAAGCWQRHLDRGNPKNDQPVMAEMVSSKVLQDKSTYYIVGIARYTVDGHTYDSEIVDLDEKTSRDSIERRLLQYAPARHIQAYYNPENPQNISLRQGMKHETLWAFFAVLLGGTLLFTGSLIYPINSYGRWVKTSAPGWIGALGYLPLYAALVPVVVFLIFLFNRYFLF